MTIIRSSITPLNLRKLLFGIAYKSSIRNAHHWTSNGIRSSFISFFKSQGHDFVPSSPVVPWNDSSIEYVNAGMNQFKSIFMGEKKSKYKSATNSQKCIRVGGKHNDLSVVGHDNYHHTFFEMLGNWSFNDFFKEESCKMSWQLLTEVYKIPQNHLYVTYFKGNEYLPEDEEVKDIWQAIGVPKDHIVGCKDNFWEMGSSGPCGPCTEIYYERIPSNNGAGKIIAGDEDLIELWNIVFVQHQRLSCGKIVPLDGYFVDTGMGLERITACLNGKLSNYDTDLFLPLFSTIQKLSGAPPYAGTFSTKKSCLDSGYRILADHSRMITVALADGFLPTDSYILRRLIRQCLTIGHRDFKLIESGWLNSLSENVVDILGPTYPSLVQNLFTVQRILQYEEELYHQTVNQTNSEWRNILTYLPELSSVNEVSLNLTEAASKAMPLIPSWKKLGVLPLDHAFNLQSTHKLSLNQLQDFSMALNLQLDLSLLVQKIEQNEVKLVETKEKESVIPEALARALPSFTDDTPKYIYETAATFCKVAPHATQVAALRTPMDSLVLEAREGQHVSVVFPSTNFYSRAGGQSGDRGEASWEGGSLQINKSDQVQNHVWHSGVVTSGVLRKEDKVVLRVDERRRSMCAKHHSASHLLMAALRYINGVAFQRNSDVDPVKISLTIFSHPPISLQQIIDAERIVKFWINEGSVISTEEKDLFSMIVEDSPAMVPSAIYPEEVRLLKSHCVLPPHLRTSSEKAVVTSCEPCCGTHQSNTAHIGDFAVTEFLDQGHGVARIKAVCGEKAKKLNKKSAQILKKLKEYEDKIWDALKQDKKVKPLRNELRNWKNNMKADSMSATAYLEVLRRFDDLNVAVDKIVVPPSNWKTLQSELADVDRPDGILIHTMKNEFWGSSNDWNSLVEDLSAVALVARARGTMRVCVVLPQSSEATLEAVIKALSECFVGRSYSNVLYNKSNCIATFVVEEVKIKTKPSLEKHLVEILNKYLS